MSAVFKYKSEQVSRRLSQSRQMRFSPYEFCTSYGYKATAMQLPPQNNTRAYCLHIPDQSDEQQPLDLRVDSRKRKHSDSFDQLDESKRHHEVQEASPPPPSPREELAEIPTDAVVPQSSAPTMGMGLQVPTSDSLAMASAPARELEGYRNGHFVLQSLLPFSSMEHQAARSGRLASLSALAMEPEEVVSVPFQPTCLPPTSSVQSATVPSGVHEESTSFVTVAANVDDHFKQALGPSVFASVCQATPPPPSLKRMRSESASPSNTVHHSPAPNNDAKSNLEDSALVPLKRRRSDSVSPSSSIHSAPADNPKSTSSKDSVYSLLKAYSAADSSAITGKPAGRKRLRNKKATVVRQRQNRSKVRPNSV